VLAYAGSIRNRLMIIHELADDHVPFANTTLLIPAPVESG
jgi:dipeptidyl aminopeptidase/acylaminoacyl peptidase